MDRRPLKGTHIAGPDLTKYTQLKGAGQLFQWAINIQGSAMPIKRTAETRLMEEMEVTVDGQHLV